MDNGFSNNSQVQCWDLKIKSISKYTLYGKKYCELDKTWVYIAM